MTGVALLLVAASAVPVLEHNASVARACPLPWGLITAGHAVPDGKTVLVAGRPMGKPLRHPSLDLALWPAPLPEGIAALDPGDAPRRGDPVLTYGLDQNLEHKEVSGELKGPLAGGGAQWVVSRSPGPGSSGSCVVDARTGKVRGVATAGKESKTTPGTFIGIMTPVDRLTRDQFRE